jgi:hypothetical protein
MWHALKFVHTYVVMSHALKYIHMLVVMSHGLVMPHSHYWSCQRSLCRMLKRVSRLGECSPTGWWLPWGNYLQNSEVEVVVDFLAKIFKNINTDPFKKTAGRGEQRTITPRNQRSPLGMSFQKWPFLASPLELFLWQALLGSLHDLTKFSVTTNKKEIAQQQ